MKNTGQVVEGTISYRPSKGEYIVEKGGVTVPVPAQNVDRVIVPRPAALDSGIASINQGKFDAAIAALEKIVMDYQGLEWDYAALDALGQAYAGKRDFKKAVLTFKRIIDGLPPERVSLGTWRRYCDALKGAEQFGLLKSELEKAIGGGSRETAALAQLLRGDMYLAQGQKNEALLDYLRTVILYEQVKEVQPEALFKAARLLEELRDPRAAELKKALIEKYPDNAYAKQISGG
jgi:TolA-binding protein